MNIKKILLSNILLFVLLFLIILTLIFLGLNFWSVLIIILYFLFYLIFISKTIAFEFLKLSYQWFVLAFIIIFSIIILSTVNPKNNSTIYVEETLTPKQCAPIYEKYNEKILDVTGEGLKGLVSIKINPEDCEANVYYSFLTTMDLPKNYTIPNSGYSEYYYAASIREENAPRDELVGTTQLRAVFTNKDTLPEPFTYEGSEALYNTKNVVEGENSNVFHNGWMSTFIFKEDSYELIKSRAVYEAVDSAPFATVESLGENSFNYSVDSDTACEKGDIVHTVQLTYTER